MYDDDFGVSGSGAGSRGASERLKKRRRRYEEPRFVDERWKDRVLWGLLGIVSFGLCL